MIALNLPTNEMMPRNKTEPRWYFRGTGGFCEEKVRLEEEFLKAIRELTALQAQQTQALIDGDPDFSRFDLLLHVASGQKDLAKYALIAHIEDHGCGGA